MSNKTKLSRQLTALLDDLFPGHKYKLSFQEYHAQHFGNEIIEYEFENFLLSIVKDRNEISVDLIPKANPDSNIGLPNFLESINAAKATDFVENDFQSVKRQLELLSRNFPKIQEKLNNSDK